MARNQVQKTLLGLAGEYHVASELCRRGYHASLTLKNHPGVDLFVQDPVFGQTRRVQVKTTLGTGRYEFFVPEHCARENTLYAFVVIDPTQQPTYRVFWLTSQQVECRSHEDHDRYLARVRKKPINPDQPYMIVTHTLADITANNWSDFFPNVLEVLDKEGKLKGEVVQ